MSKKNGRGASKTTGQDHQGWPGVLVVGFVLGVATTLGLQYLLQSGRNGSLPQLDSGAEAESAGGAERDFEFYTLLNDMTVQVPDSDVVLAEDDNIIYWLQAGSFRSPEDAENMRVNLILKNLEAEVRPVSNEGVLWHRVVVGPFATRTLVNKAKETLIADGLQPITLRQELP